MSNGPAILVILLSQPKRPSLKESVVSLLSLVLKRPRLALLLTTLEFEFYDAYNLTFEK